MNFIETIGSGIVGAVFALYLKYYYDTCKDRVEYLRKKKSLVSVFYDLKGKIDMAIVEIEGIKNTVNRKKDNPFDKSDFSFLEISLIDLFGAKFFDDLCEKSKIEYKLFFDFFCLCEELKTTNSTVIINDYVESKNERIKNYKNDLQHLQSFVAPIEFIEEKTTEITSLLYDEQKEYDAVFCNRVEYSKGKMNSIISIIKEIEKRIT